MTPGERTLAAIVLEGIRKDLDAAKEAAPAPAPAPEPLPQSIDGLTAAELIALKVRAPKHYQKLMDEKARRAYGGRTIRGPYHNPDTSIGRAPAPWDPPPPGPRR